MNTRAQRTLLESAVRTANTSCAQQTDRFSKSARLYLNVTNASGTGGLTLQVRGYDKASADAQAFVIFADTAAITATGQYTFDFAPGITSLTGDSRRRLFSGLLPINWDVNIVHADGSNYTYTLSADLTS